MSTIPSVTLRYFAVVGRGQPLRHALADAGVPFEDVRITLRDWPAVKDDMGQAGPYRALPALTWGDTTIAETLAIAGFLSRELGHYAGLTNTRIAELEGVASTAYLDVSGRFGEMIWSEVMHPGIDPRAAFARTLPRVAQKLASLDARTPPGWFRGQEPGLADFFAAEAFETFRYVLGPEYEARVVARFPRLADLAARVRERPRLAAVFESRPACFTARPDEPDALAVRRKADLSSAGF